MKYYVVAPFTKDDLFTQGKIYELEIVEVTENNGRAFNFKLDNGGMSYCLEFGCCYLSGGNWDIIEEPDETSPKKSTKTASECQAEMLCSFYKAISQAGGDVGSFNMDMTLRDIVGSLAQNGVRFTYNKADKCSN